MKRFINKTAIDSSAVTADENSATLDFAFMETWSAHIVWTSTTAAATIKIQESNDGTNWVDISGASQAISNNSGNTMLSSVDLGAQYLRVLVDHTSGTVTTLNVKVVGKGR